MIFENFTLDLTRPISQILFAILFCRFPKQLLRVRLPRHLPRGRVRRPQLHEARHQVQEDLRRLRRVHRSHSPSRRGANQWVKRKKLTFFTLSYSVFFATLPNMSLIFSANVLPLTATPGVVAPLFLVVLVFVTAAADNCILYWASHWRARQQLWIPRTTK